MSRTVIAVSDFNNAILKQYVENQLQAIAELHADYVIQHVNSDNSIMIQHAKYQGRLPAYFILKKGVVMNQLQAKVDTETLLAWINSSSG